MKSKAYYRQFPRTGPVPPHSMVVEFERTEMTRWSDERLFDELREQINRSRNFHNHDRQKVRDIAAEMVRRGWKVYV
jgi:hypothetical protein